MLFSLLYSLLYSPLLFTLSFLRFLNKKLNRGFILRKKTQGQRPWLNWEKGQQPLWFHCASGEFEYAKPVIRLLKQRHPEQKIMVTYFSPSAEKSIANTPEVDFYTPTPWDTSRHWQRFIEYHEPKALLIARTDLWPMMIQTANAKKIPCLLFSKTEDPTKGFLQKKMSAFLLKKMDDIFCATEDDRQALYQRLKPFQRIHASGDTRYDQCLFRLQHAKPLKPLNNFSRPIFIAGSTWSADHQALLPLIESSAKDVSFIIAPHEPDEKHLKELSDQLTARGLTFQKYSQVQSWNPQSVLIIDQVGILADLYAWGDFAFIGGSMDRSVHSVMEALAQGLLTFVGPFHRNNREAMIYKHCKIKEMTPVQEVQDGEQLVRRFQALYRSWTPQHKLDLQLSVRSKAGASELVYKWCLNTGKLP